MANAQLTTTTTVKISEGADETASRSISGNMELVEYTQLIDVLDPSTTDKLISFGGLVDVDYMYIESDQEITFKLNGIGTQSLTLKNSITSGTNTKSVFEFTSDSITALHMSNASTSTSAKVKYIFGKLA